MALKIRLKIDGTDRQDNLLETEWVIERNAHGKLDHVTFTIDDPTNAISLSRGKDVIVEDFNDATTRLFGGVLTEVVTRTNGLGRVFSCKALDWTFLLDRALVNFTYRGKSDQFIITDATDGIFAKSETDLSDFTVNNTNVKVGNGNTQFLQFKRSTIRDVMDTLKGMAGENWVWYVDPNKTVYSEPFGTQSHAFHLSDDPDDSDSFAYLDLVRTINITKVINRVTVEGAFLRELYADIAIADTDYEGDGTKVKFNLGDLWQASSGNTRIKVFINDGADADPTWGSETEKTVGLAGSDSLSSFDTLWDPAARTLEWATAPPNKDHSFRIEGDLLRPLIAVKSDQASINDLGRIYAYSIKDVTILSDEHAYLKAKAELRKKGAEAERLSLSTTKDGLTPGLNIGLVNSIMGIGSASVPAEYLVDKVVTRLLGGQVAKYDLNLTAVS